MSTPSKATILESKHPAPDLEAPGLEAPGLEAPGLHRPVLLREMLAALRPRDGCVYLDATFGGGGYAGAILDRARCTVWAIDRDPAAVARGRAMAAARESETGGRRLHLIEGSFGDMVALLAAHGVSTLDGVVMDLGVSSFQLDQPSRGFSFRHDGPLDMRMSGQGRSAADLVNGLSESDLADILYTFGEERLSRRIARAIVEARADGRLETTLQLARIIRAVMPKGRPDRIDPATRSFQALRIEVNDELGEIRRGLDAAACLLAPGGRLVVVSFHSLEDRIVKRFMIGRAGKLPSPSRHDPRGIEKSRSVPANFRLLENKALQPDEAESSANPRARSARLRGLQRLPAARDSLETTASSGSLA